jgi:hypothetical protein
VPFLISPKTAALELEAAAEIIRLRKKLAEREKRHD